MKGVEFTAFSPHLEKSEKVKSDAPIGQYNYICPRKKESEKTDLSLIDYNYNLGASVDRQTNWKNNLKVVSDL